MLNKSFNRQTTHKPLITVRKSTEQELDVHHINKKISVFSQNAHNKVLLSQRAKARAAGTLLLALRRLKTWR